MNSLETLTQQIFTFPIDRDFLPQDKLDIVQRRTTSLYPWRGQFSPGLVELLLEVYARKGTIVLDPFMGSGTTLFQAARRGLECYGAEVNPAAVQLAGMVRFANADEHTRKRTFASAEQLLEKHIDGFLPANLFRQHIVDKGKISLTTAVKELLGDAAGDPLLHNLLTTSVMLAMSDGEELEAETLYKAYSRNRSIVSKIPVSSNACKVFMSDARDLPLSDQSVDLVITSPPYINVFNYHQNYRKAMELMGWYPLEIAQSELGSNRKHRGNRFMTVVQYCMDLTRVCQELRRVLGPGGVAVFIIGRESRVRGVPFNNGQLLALSAVGGAGFQLDRWQERKFVNRYGEKIYEDVITLVAQEKEIETPEEFGREVGVLALSSSLDIATGEVSDNIEQAIERSVDVRPSPLLKLVSEENS